MSPFHSGGMLRPEWRWRRARRGCRGCLISLRREIPSPAAAVPLRDVIDDWLLDALLERSRDEAGGRLTGEGSMLGDLVRLCRDGRVLLRHGRPARG